jgi:GcrA cell cycle regulator
VQLLKETREPDKIVQLFKAVAVVTAPKIAPKPPVIQQTPVAKPMGKPRRVALCCWPIGAPKTKGFRFCEKEAVPGRPYCKECCEKAYVRVRDRREDATV